MPKAKTRATPESIRLEVFRKCYPEGVVDGEPPKGEDTPEAFMLAERGFHEITCVLVRPDTLPLFTAELIIAAANNGLDINSVLLGPALDDRHFDAWDDMEEIFDLRALELKEKATWCAEAIENGKKYHPGDTDPAVAEGYAASCQSFWSNHYILMRW